MLEEDFVSIFKPLYVISSMYCVKKFNLNGTIISANTKHNFVYSALGICLVYGLLYITLKDFKDTFDVPMVFYMYTIAYAQFALNYTILNFVNFRLSSYNVQLILKLQEIDRLLGDVKDTRRLKRVVWASCFCLFIGYTLFVTTKVFTDPHWNCNRAVFNFATLIFDVELTYFTIVLLYLTRKSDRWIDALRAADAAEDSFPADEIFVGYKALIDARVLMKTVSQWTILLHFTIIFVQSITYVQILITWMKYGGLDLRSIASHALGVALFIAKGLVAEAALCIVCDMLYERMSCAFMQVVKLETKKNSEIRSFVRNITRLNKMHLVKFSACGVLTVDAALPLRLGALIANYTVVLLQFALL